MNILHITIDAERDLRDIHEFISRYSSDSAHRTILRLRGAFLNLADNRFLGTSRTELRNGVRGLSVTPYIIFYELSDDRIEILRIIHGSRDITRLF